MGYNVKPFL